MRRWWSSGGADAPVGVPQSFSTCRSHDLVLVLDPVVERAHDATERLPQLRGPCEVARLTRGRAPCLETGLAAGARSRREAQHGDGATFENTR